MAVEEGQLQPGDEIDGEAFQGAAADEGAAFSDCSTNPYPPLLSCQIATGLFRTG